MKNIEIDEELYQYIATNTQYIGESASTILRRLLKFGLESAVENLTINQIVDDADSTKLTAVTAPDIVDNAIPPIDDEVATNEESEITSNHHETVFNFINKEELAMQRGAVGRFLLILAGLYRAHPNHFSVVTEISGRDRLYFANSESKLAESGSSTKPRQIPESPFWVITNSNTTRKKMMLTKASISLGYSDEDVEKIRELL